jgi:hypothetical protein
MAVKNGHYRRLGEELTVIPSAPNTRVGAVIKRKITVLFNEDTNLFKNGEFGFMGGAVKLPFKNTVREAVEHLVMQALPDWELIDFKKVEETPELKVDLAIADIFYSKDDPSNREESDTAMTKLSRLQTNLKASRTVLVATLPEASIPGQSLGTLETRNMQVKRFVPLATSNVNPWDEFYNLIKTEESKIELLEAQAASESKSYSKEGLQELLSYLSDNDVNGDWPEFEIDGPVFIDGNSDDEMTRKLVDIFDKKGLFGYFQTSDRSARIVLTNLRLDTLRLFNCTFLGNVILHNVEVSRGAFIRGCFFHNICNLSRITFRDYFAFENNEFSLNVGGLDKTEALKATKKHGPGRNPWMNELNIDGAFAFRLNEIATPRDGSEFAMVFNECKFHARVDYLHPMNRSKLVFYQTRFDAGIFVDLSFPYIAVAPGSKATIRKRFGTGLERQEIRMSFCDIAAEVVIRESPAPVSREEHALFMGLPNRNRSSDLEDSGNQAAKSAQDDAGKEPRSQDPLLSTDVDGRPSAKSFTPGSSNSAGGSKCHEQPIAIGRGSDGKTACDKESPHDEMVIQSINQQCREVGKAECPEESKNDMNLESTHAAYDVGSGTAGDQKTVVAAGMEPLLYESEYGIGINLVGARLSGLIDVSAVRVRWMNCDRLTVSGGAFVLHPSAMFSSGGSASTVLGRVQEWFSRVVFVSPERIFLVYEELVAKGIEQPRFSWLFSRSPRYFEISKPELLSITVFRSIAQQYEDLRKAFANSSNSFNEEDFCQYKRLMWTGISARHLVDRLSVVLTFVGLLFLVSITAALGFFMSWLGFRGEFIGGFLPYQFLGILMLAAFGISKCRYIARVLIDFVNRFILCYLVFPARVFLTMILTIVLFAVLFTFCDVESERPGFEWMGGVNEPGVSTSRERRSDDLNGSVLAFVNVVDPVSSDGLMLGPDFPVRRKSYLERFPSMLYYSGVTFSTLGYGDLTPRGFSRFLANMEAVIGAIWLSLLTVALARLVRVN